MNIVIKKNHDCMLDAGHPLLEIADHQCCNCLNLYPGLLLRCVELNETGNVSVDFQNHGGVLEFGCLVSGRIRGTATFDNGRICQLDAEAGHTWCSFCTKSRGAIEYFSGQPISVVSFIIYGPLLKNLPLFQSEKSELALQSTSREPFYRTGKLTPEVKQIVHQIVQRNEHSDAQNQLFLMAKAYELLFYLSAVVHEEQEDDAHILEKKQAVTCAQTILENNLSSPPNLAHLARQSGLCVTYLTKEFKKQFGTTVFGYLRQKRMERAKELITLYDMSASEAAWEVGYSSLSSFHKAFYSRYGATPGSFCRKNLLHL